MNRVRKTMLWATGGAGILLLLLIGLALVAPRAIDLASVKAKVEAEFERKTGNEVEFRTLDIALLPQPHFELHGVRFSLPGKLTGSLETLTVYPRILPLFMGRVEITKMRLAAPQFVVQLPETLRHEEEPGSSFSPAEMKDIKEKVGLLFSVLQSRVGGLVIEVDRGSLQLARGGQSPFVFQEINGSVHLPPSSLSVHLNCESSTLAEKISLQGSFDPKSFSSQGQILLTRFHPQRLEPYLFPSEPARLGDSDVDLNLSFSGEGPSRFDADFNASIPLLTLNEGDETLKVSGQAIEGGVAIDGAKFSVELTNVVLDSPQLSLTGKLLVDPNGPTAQLHLRGQDVDAAAVRKVALALWGSNSTVQKTFDIVRGGRVPAITYDAEGSCLADLKKSEHFVLTGSMVGGEIFVPKAELMVGDAQGDVTIANGILDGRNLEGRTGNSTGTGGILTLGLKKDETGDAPFHLDILLNADLAQLPPVLDRVVKNEKFLHELSLIRDVKGRAIGTLTLGESLKSVKTRVETKEFNLAGSYERIPYPVELEGQAFRYEGSHVALESSEVRIGRSRLPHFSGLVDWGETSELLEMSASKPGEISLDEVYPWLVSYDGPKAFLKAFKAVKGTFFLDTLALKGPLRRPRQWSFQLNGTVNGLTIQSTIFPGPLSVNSGGIDADQENLAMRDCRTNLLDTALTVSGSLRGYLSGLSGANLSLEGNVGPQGNQWLSQLAHLKPELWLRSPISISQSRFTWEKGGKTALVGSGAVKDGPAVTADLTMAPDEVDIRSFTIRDKDSNASFSLGTNKREFNLGFSGTLSKPTVDKLLVSNRLLSGAVKGDLKAHLVRSRPLDSTASGRLEMTGFDFPWRSKVPVRVEKASLEASGNKVNVKSSDLLLLGSPSHLQGSIAFSSTGYLLDLDLAVDSVNWESLGPLTEKGDQEGPAADTQSRSPDHYPLQGAVRASIGEFTFKKLTWRPLEAKVSFHDGSMDFEIDRADLCGIPTPGEIRTSPERVQVDLAVKTQDQELAPAFTCLWDRKEFMDGAFNLTGAVTAQGPKAAISGAHLIESLEGNLEFSAKNGRIYRLGILSKIFSFLNLTEVYRGKLPDLVESGFAYDSIWIQGKFKEGKILMKDAVVDGASMKIVWNGEVDLVHQTLDLKVLLGPLRTVDRIVGHIPVLGDVLGGSLLSIPVEVSGSISDPSVIPLSPSAVGSELFGYMKRTFQLPFKMFQPLTE